MPAVRQKVERVLVVNKKPLPGGQRLGILMVCLLAGEFFGEDGGGIRFVGDDTQEFKGFVANVLVPVWDVFGDEDDVTFFYFEDFIGYADAGLACQDVLFMLDSIGVTRHAASRFHDKAPQGKIGGFLGRDKYLFGGFDCIGYFDGCYVARVFD
jgi:hypothetical protein